MHIVIYGVGAVGGFYGTILARYIQEHSEHQLSFIARGKTLEVLKTKGIELIRRGVSDFAEAPFDEIIKLAVNAYASYSELPQAADVVLVCVKSQDTIEVAKSIRLEADAYVVSVQNGVENEEKLASVLGRDKVLGCFTTLAAENLEPGKYIQKANYVISFAEMPGNENYKRATELKELMCAAKINARVTDDLYKSLWSKLVWNAGFNPLSALHELEIGPLIAAEQETILGLMRETREVAHAQGIMIRDDIVEFHFNNTNTRAWDSFRTSMLQDALAGKPIELDDILGVLIKRGEQCGVATPYASKVYDLCKAKFGGV